MARPEKCRSICYPPKMKGFKPFGMPICKNESIILTFEEYESIRLVSYENYSQKEAAEKMNVSRPTLTRIYNKAIKNITNAFIEGKTIKIEGGNYKLDDEWYRCSRCNSLIEVIDNHVKCESCSEYKQEKLIKLNK